MVPGSFTRIFLLQAAVRRTTVDLRMAEKLAWHRFARGQFLIVQARFPVVVFPMPRQDDSFCAGWTTIVSR